MNSFGGGGGGGFMMNNSPGMGGSQDSPASKKKYGNNRCIMALTIAQIERAAKMSDTDDAQFWLDGREIGLVKLVGFIRSFKSDSTKSTFTIDDGTGVITVTHWHTNNTDEDAQERQTYSVSKTVQVFGNITNFGGQRRISTFKFLPVDDSNIVTFHMLECMSQHVQATRGGPVGSGSLGATAQSATSAAMPVDSAFGEQRGQPDNGNSLTAHQNMVLQAIMAVTSEEGVSIQELVSKLSGSVNEQKTREIVDWLSEEGHIYSTVDEEHYRSTD